MNENLEKVRVEAEARFPSIAKMSDGGIGAITHDSTEVFVAGRTVTQAQLDKAAEAYMGTIVWLKPGEFQDLDQKTIHVAYFEAKNVLRSAGFLIEGEDV